MPITGERSFVYGDAEILDRLDARRVEFVEADKVFESRRVEFVDADEVVESSGNSTTSHV